MFCPNCGNENQLNHRYCRSCGLKLDAIVKEVSGQFPSKEYAGLQRSKERFEKMGMVSLSIAGVIGLSLLLFQAAYFKLLLLGQEVLIGSAVAALIAFLLASLFFFHYPNFSKKFEKLDSPLPHSPEKPALTSPTNKLIEDKPFETVPSVTEHSTELLPAGKKRNVE
jgi:hypothetical protein